MLLQAAILTVCNSMIIFKPSAKAEGLFFIVLRKRLHGFSQPTENIKSALPDFGRQAKVFFNNSNLVLFAARKGIGERFTSEKIIRCNAVVVSKLVYHFDIWLSLLVFIILICSNGYSQSVCRLLLEYVFTFSDFFKSHSIIISLTTILHPKRD